MGLLLFKPTEADVVVEIKYATKLEDEKMA